MRIYLAGPLFTVGERAFNLELARLLESRWPELQIELPQELAETVPKDEQFAKRVFELSLEAIGRCDAVLAVLEGADADSGTCVELGYALAQSKPIVGMRTDMRASEDQGLNLMVSQLCTVLVHRTDTDMTLEELASDVIRAMERTVL